MVDFKPAPKNELDVRVARINEQEGIIDNLVIVSADYEAKRNDRYIIVDNEATITLPVVNIGKKIMVKRTGAYEVTIDGGDYNIDGSATRTLSALYNASEFIFIGDEWSIVTEI